MDRLKTFSGKDGPFDFLTGERVTLTDGYMVSFHQNEPDENGHYKSHWGRYTPEEYDRLTEEFAAQNDAEVYIGVFGDQPEISFKVKTKKQAIDLMVLNNQDSYWDNAKRKLKKNKNYVKFQNPMRGE